MREICGLRRERKYSNEEEEGERKRGTTNKKTMSLDKMKRQKEKGKG